MARTLGVRRGLDQYVVRDRGEMGSIIRRKMSKHMYQIEAVIGINLLPAFREASFPITLEETSLSSRHLELQSVSSK